MAYGEARYKDGYIISWIDVEVLISKVQSLQKLAMHWLTEVTHFNNFFNKHMQLSPLKFKNV
jgi:hypothetical protein